MYLILGYGLSGQATEKYLHSIGCSTIVYDEGKHLTPQINWQAIKFVVQSPGIAPNHTISELATGHNIPICTDIDLLQKRSPKAKYIGITGTNGKSTTTALIGHILEQAGFKTAVGGNIGKPVLELPELGNDSWYVLELSSYQLELSQALSFETAVWLNISPDHIERHKTMENYVKAKQRIFLNAKNAVIGVDDNFSQTTAKSLNIGCQTASILTSNADAYVNNLGILDIAGETFDLNAAQYLMGEHNWQNIAVAFLATLPILKNATAVFEHIKTFPGLAHRQQQIATIDNVLFVNDSKATNADAAEKALKTYSNYDIFWIVGGKAKTDGIDALAPYFSTIKKAYLIGEAATKFSETLNGEVNFTICNTLDKAVNVAFNDAKFAEKPVVLFAPACASFDQFKDFEHRGETFQNLVEAIKC
jgi:UDP-N-acetylmuramoylalanine--D-glutamate ligase